LVRTLSFSWNIKIWHSIFKICILSSQPIIFSVFHFQFFLNISCSFLRLLCLNIDHCNVFFSLIQQSFESINLFFSHINLILIRWNFKLWFLVHFLLAGHKFIHLFSHVFYLLGLSMIDIWLSIDLLMAFLNFLLRFLKFFACILIIFSSFCKLDLNVP
jgi:hypothetical protein